MSNVDATLKERGNRYGEFDTQAQYAQDIKRVIQRSPNWNLMHDDQREALELIANKIGRILNGDPDYTDSWHDIAGYAQLVEKGIEKRASQEDLEEYNARVVGYLDDLIRNPFEQGDYDPIHEQAIQQTQYHQAYNQESEDPALAGLAGVVGSKVLGFHTIWPEGEVDPLATEPSVSLRD